MFMSNEKRRDLLTKELANVIEQVEICRAKMGAKGYFNQSEYFTDQNNQFKTILANMNLKIQSNKPLSKKDIRDFRTKLKEIKFSYSNWRQAGVMYEDAVSVDYSTWESMVANLIYCLRAVFRAFDWFEGEVKGETPFSLRLTGHSQFLPRPITTIRDAQKRLDNLNERLEKAILSCDS